MVPAETAVNGRARFVVNNCGLRTRGVMSQIIDICYDVLLIYYNEINRRYACCFLLQFICCIVLRLLIVKYN